MNTLRSRSPARFLLCLLLLWMGAGPGLQHLAQGAEPVFAIY